MSARVSRRLEDRDIDVILNGLCYGAMCNEHLMAFSRMHARPFACEDNIRRRTRSLNAMGVITTRYYATKKLRGRAYHTLTAKGFRHLQRCDPSSSERKLFRKVSENDQQHHFWMMHFYVKTLVACNRKSVRLLDYVPENVGSISVYSRTRPHDGRFRLQLPGVLDFNFIVEVDNHTETLHSDTPKYRTVEQWMTTYLHYDNESPRREQVLIVSTRGGERLRNMLALAARLTSNPKRKMFLGLDLPAFLAAGDPLTGPYCLTHHREQAPLLWYPNRLTRLLAAVHDAPAGLRTIVQRSRHSPFPFTSSRQVKSDLRTLYHHGLVDVKHWYRGGRPILQFVPTPQGESQLLL